VVELVLEDLLRVEQEAPDQRALAVVDRAGGGDPQELGAAGSRGQAAGVEQLLDGVLSVLAQK
jgi:hypothetical protein